MAKRNLGRVQGASLFYYDSDAGSLVINRDLLVPNDLTPMVGDTILDKRYTIYTVVNIINKYLTVKVDVNLTIDDLSFTYATDEDIIKLFE